MREIKFRGYSVDDDKWVYGFYVFDEFKGANGRAGIAVVDTPLGFELTTVHPKSVGQYTGLKDKSGTEIYEGDILGKTFHLDLFVRFQNGKFMLYDTNLVRRNNDYTYDLYRNVVEGYCVIGNIFENPELIERQEARHD